jgi:peptidoglycan/LPS O-acetylase OafA/YrhL
MIDAIKAFGCLLIVLHHLAFYGPMSDVVASAWPMLVTGLYDHGRLAVSLFLVCSGFLTASHLARYEALDLPEVFKLLMQRYLRLVIPLLAALSFTVLVTEWVRPAFEHASLSATPDWGQALAHVMLLQHLLDMEALSAGIWYVAIDFQLYAMALLSLLLVKVCRCTLPVCAVLSTPALRWGFWLGLTCASLWWWNLQPTLDDHGVYFFGAYGLGLLAWGARQPALRVARDGAVARWMVWALFLALGGVAWWLEPRWRLAVAWGVACLLMAVPDGCLSGQAVRSMAVRQTVQSLSERSYSVFLIHFGVSLAVNAGVTAMWPEAVWANVLGLLSALLLSVVLGAWLHRFVEQHTASWRRWWFWVGVFKASVALALFMNPVV